MIDPNFWQSDDVSKLNPTERLLLIGMFSLADDHGRGRANPSFLRSSVFPCDNFSVSRVKTMLEHIAEHISIKFYAVSDTYFYRFDNWDKWQTVQHPSDSLIPDEPLMNDSRMIHELFSPNINQDKLREDKLSKEKDGQEDFIGSLLQIFCDSYERAFGDKYVVVNEGKERQAIGRLLSVYKRQTSGATTESTEADFKTFFDSAVSVKDAWLRDNVSPSLIASKFNEYKRKTDGTGQQKLSADFFAGLYQRDFGGNKSR